MKEKLMKPTPALALLILLSVTLAFGADAWERFEPACNVLAGHLGAGRYEEAEAMFNDAMRKSVPASALGQVMDPLRQAMGEFETITSHRETEKTRG